jgi:4-amino-4-deoxy-L-arabinose transferase-like glycosyltransferase
MGGVDGDSARDAADAPGDAGLTTPEPAGGTGRADGTELTGEAAPADGPPPGGPPAAAPPGWLASRWTRLSALAVIAVLAGLAYGWGIGRDPLEPYYAAAVRSMAGSWHDFLYGSFDPAGTITLDKLPGAFWVQALSVRAFGYSTWAMILPQVVEGILTVLVLYRAVARLAGPLAGLVAALVLAVSPAVVALDRGNISDSLMILLLVIAADAVSGAIARDGHGQLRLLLAGACVGLAFQAKMIEAWLVLPALGLAYLVSGPGTVRRRVRQAVVAGLVAGVVSVAWMSAVSLVPAGSRPYVDGSQHNSMFEQVFTYNGLGRFDQETPLQELATEVAPTGEAPPAVTAAPGADRLLAGTLGRDAGWLLPAAAAAGIWGLVSRRRQPRRDPERACLILWGGWLATLWVAFSALTTINAYYTAALAPAAAAILGTGAVLAGRGWKDAAVRGRIALSVGLAVIVAGTAAYTAWLIPGTGTHDPGWLAPAMLAVAAVAVVIALAALAARRVFAVALGVGTVAVALVPAVASAGMAASHESAFDTPFESARVAAAADALPEYEQQRVPQIITQLQALQGKAPDLMATQTAAVAAIFAGSADPRPGAGGRPGGRVPPRHRAGPHHRPAPGLDRRALRRPARPGRGTQLLLHPHRRRRRLTTGCRVTRGPRRPGRPP